MRQKLQVLRRVEATRLLLFAGLVFILIVGFQYVNVQYSSVVFLLSAEDKIPISRNDNNGTLLPSSESETLSVKSMSSSNIYHAPEVDGREDVLERKRIVSDEGHILDSEMKDLQDTFMEDDTDNDNESPDFETRRSSNKSLSSPSALPPEDLPTDIESTEDASTNSDYERKEKLEILENESDHSVDKLAPEVEKLVQVPNSGVFSISQMMSLLNQSHNSHVSRKPRWSSPVDRELLYARNQIENSPIIENDPLLHASLYWNLSMFKSRSYELMEKMLKVYVYREGKRPIMHKPVLKGIYASEGWFMKLLKSSKTFITKDPHKAHLFYLPFSSKMLEKTLYVPGSHSDKNLVEFLKNYLDMISTKYRYWNRTEGSDHFLAACHDWAPSETRRYMGNCIRALCNSDVTEGFVFGKDVALPETTILFPRRPLRAVGGKPPTQRPILAFFAGGMHGYFRPLLVKRWGGSKDPDMKIFSQMSKGKDMKRYIQYMKSSKYCICPRGYEVNSPRVVEAIFYECVPVIISDNFVPPFFEALNWESFAVFVMEKDVGDLKRILQSIPDEKYRKMQMRVKMVQKHFLWHAKPEKYDIFHMILHSVWFNRVFQS
ncbi:PREDICTED: probable glycosyltransferase At3g07620 isoform X3 [Tarenaya hassleriana]|uniref:probable glycosyltransferase At3g07620 isoform X3 n=1 Tax=Tarenaya hassleriana TaxID=28532 RepID=UPI00053C2346|nr:PREDICTED: probable glycosyltransferase At3g07620 isoform X3 [Tarenaya hassleriana]